LRVGTHGPTVSGMVSDQKLPIPSIMAAREDGIDNHVEQIREDGFSRELTRVTGRRLQNSYEVILNEPLSPQMQELLQRLDRVSDEPLSSRRLIDR
jgi:hypothetical protein